jgi:hypothetical protein
MSKYWVKGLNFDIGIVGREFYFPTVTLSCLLEEMQIVICRLEDVTISML